MSIYLLCVIGVIAISALCGFIFIPAILNYCEVHQLYDFPNARKVHQNAVSRLGGISFLPSMFIAFVIALIIISTTSPLISINLWTFNFLVGLLLIYGVGIVDDVIGLSAKTKFVVQIVAACILPASGLYINNLYGFLGINEVSYAVGFILTVFIIVFITNAINLIDGIDGLAGSLSIMALLGFLYIFYRQEIWAYSILIAGLIGVLIPFLYFNLFGKQEKNRKIFMGDSGSLTLGYIMGFLCVKYSMENTSVMTQRMFNFFLPYTLLLVPMFDVVKVFFVRIWHKASPFVADKNHIHHKLLDTGLSQHQTLLVIIGIELFYIVLNCLLFEKISISLIFLIDAITYAIISLVIDYKSKQNIKKC